MNKFNKLLSLFFVFSIVAFFTSCSSSAPTDDGSDDSSGNDKISAPTVLYLDSETGKYKGTVTYTANTIEMQVLLTGFIDEVTWNVEAPTGFSEFTYGKNAIVRGSYSVNPDTYTLVANLETDFELFDVWYNVPGVKVNVIIEFTTGSYINIATQDGYGDTSSNSYYDTGAEYYVYGWPEIREKKRSDTRVIQLYYYGAYSKANKIKSAKAYIYEDSGLTNPIQTLTAENDLTDISKLETIASSNSNPCTDFSTSWFTLSWLKSLAPDGVVKIEVTLVSGAVVAGTFNITGTKD